MGKASRNRHLRRVAKDVATKEYKTTNENINIKQVESSRLVINSEGVYVNEIVPQVTFNTQLDDDCARKIYKHLKKEKKDVS